jgi:DMSO reductase anchor subunit
LLNAQNDAVFDNIYKHILGLGFISSIPHLSSPLAAA